MTRSIDAEDEMTLSGKLAVGTLAIVLLSQAYRPARTNPPVEPEKALDAGGRLPAAVATILQQSCSDCHSDSTTWPWYSHVAPVSWMVASHVSDGRRHLNFSTWNSLPLDRKQRTLGEICDEITTGAMPEWTYLIVHRNARLTAAQISAVCGWTKAESARLSAESSAPPPFEGYSTQGGLIFVAGITPDAAQAGSTITQQAGAVLTELSARLARAGSSLEQVVSTTVSLKDARDLSAFVDAWKQFWPAAPPARTVVVTRIAPAQALVQVSAVAVPAGARPSIVHPRGWTAPPGPFSYALRTGDTVFVSGLVTRRGADGSLVPGDIAAQTRTVLDNARAILGEAGLTLAEVVNARVFITDPAQFQAMNEAYRAYFPSAPPTRATVRTALAEPEALVQIALTAVKGAGRTVFTTPSPDGKPGQANPNLSSAIGIGGRLYLSGMLGMLPGNAADPVSQTQETLGRLERTMALAGYGWSDIVDSVVYVTDVSKAGPVMQAVKARMGGRLPAGSLVESGLMSPDGLVEIMLVAGK